MIKHHHYVCLKDPIAKEMILAIVYQKKKMLVPIAAEVMMPHAKKPRTIKEELVENLEVKERRTSRESQDKYTHLLTHMNH